jgi:hypothetical protein
MEINKLRSIIKEAIKDVHLKEIEAVAENAAMEARLAEYGKAIKMCEDKIEMAESLEEMKELVDDVKLNELKKKLKSLTKAKEKLEKAKAKKNKGKEVVTDEPMDESAVEEGDAMDSMENAIVPEMDYTMEEEEAINESFLKMQKLAGVITETQYNQKKSLIENQLEEDSKTYGIEKDSSPYDFGPYTAEEAKDIAAKLSAKNPRNFFQPRLLKDMEDDLPAIDRMGMPGRSSKGMSSGDLGDY